MSFELQLAAAAHAGVEELKKKLALIEEHLGEDLQEFLAQKKHEETIAAVASQPIELTPEEKQAIIASRLEIAKQTSAKNAPQS